MRNACQVSPARLPSAASNAWGGGEGRQAPTHNGRGAYGRASRMGCHGVPCPGPTARVTTCMHAPCSCPRAMGPRGMGCCTAPLTAPSPSTHSPPAGRQARREGGSTTQQWRLSSSLPQQHPTQPVPHTVCARLHACGTHHTKRPLSSPLALHCLKPGNPHMSHHS